MLNYDELNIASNILEKYYTIVKSDCFYNKIMNSSTFKNKNISEALYLINDESYSYIINNFLNYVNKNEYKVLYNIFSGSGRLIREIKEHNLIYKFKEIYNIDISSEMISFEKSVFNNLSNVQFICGDFLDLDICNYDESIIVCHCGLRYLGNEKIRTFVKKIKELLFGNSICFVSEIKYSFIKLLIEELNNENLNYDLNEYCLLMHRNTRLYTSFWLYNNNDNFNKIIDKISICNSMDYKKVLTEISGYKKDKLFVLKVSNKK